MVDLTTYIISVNRLSGEKDVILKKFKCKTKTVGCFGDSKFRKNSRLLEKYFTNISNVNGFKFYSEELKELYTKMFEIDIPLEERTLPLTINLRKKHIAIATYAADPRRIYPAEYWVKILNYILDKIDNSTELLFLGSGSSLENEYIDNIISKLKYPEKCINSSGYLNTCALTSILSHCKFLLSVETGTVHCAKGAGCECICICNGQAYGRFLPYKNGVKYIFPDSFEEKMKNPTYEFKLNVFDSCNYNISISEILPEKVIEVVEKYLNNPDFSVTENNKKDRLFPDMYSEVKK